MKEGKELAPAKGQKSLADSFASPLRLWWQKQPQPNVATGLTRGNCGPSHVPEVKGSLAEI